VLTQKDLNVQKQPWLLLAMTVQKKFRTKKNFTFAQHNDIIDDVPVLTQKVLKVEKQTWVLFAMTKQKKINFCATQGHHRRCPCANTKIFKS